MACCFSGATRLEVVNVDRSSSVGNTNSIEVLTTFLHEDDQVEPIR